MTALAGLCSWVAAGDGEADFGVVDDPVLGRLSAEFLSLAPDDGHAVAAAFHEVLPLLRALNAANRQARQNGRQRFVAGDLARFHALDGEVVGQRAGRLDFQSVSEH